jgi:hypothetical protein
MEQKLMEQLNNENSLEKTSQLLNALQQQLIRYKTALDSIDSAAESTEKVAGALENLSAIFGELNRAQTELAQSFNDTRRALIFTQQKTQQMNKDLEELGQNFTRNINGVMQKAAAEMDQKIRESASGNEIIKKEVRLLRNILFGNVFVLFLLMFTFFMYSGNRSSSDETDFSSAAETPLQQNETILGDSGMEASSSAASAFDYLKIQILNGCGKGGVGQQFQTFLENRNVKIANTENADHFEYLNTIIHTSSATSEASAIAELLGLGKERVLPGNPRWRNYDVTIIIGKDYKSLGPNREVR